MPFWRSWCFEMDKLPLNARVCYPEGAGRFPLALMVQGKYGMAEFSGPGYADGGTVSQPTPGSSSLPSMRTFSTADCFTIFPGRSQSTRALHPTATVEESVFRLLKYRSRARTRKDAGADGSHRLRSCACNR